MQKIANISLLVADYDAAIDWFTQKLGFDLVANDDMGNGKRWVIVAPAGRVGTNLLLAKAGTPEQERHIGDQTGGRVFLFLQTDDFERDYGAMADRGVHFIEEPRHEAYGSVVVFEDICGNRWDLIEMKG